MENKVLNKGLIAPSPFIIIMLISLSNAAAVVNNQLSNGWKDNTLTPIWMPAVPLREDQYPSITDSFIPPEFDRYEKSDSSPVIRQTDTRIMMKKDNKPRNWGAGGFPFSVLYLDPHVMRTSQPDSKKQPILLKKPSDISSTPSSTVRNSNHRLAMRNGGSGQPRRQYSIIPQLFISYGWSPLGK